MLFCPPYGGRAGLLHWETASTVGGTPRNFKNNFGFPFALSCRECLWVINIEAHAAQCWGWPKKANTITYGGQSPSWKYSRNVQKGVQTLYLGSFISVFFASFRMLNVSQWSTLKLVRHIVEDGNNNDNNLIRFTKGGRSPTFTFVSPQSVLRKRASENDIMILYTGIYIYINGRPGRHAHGLGSSSASCCCNGSVG